MWALSLLPVFLVVGLLVFRFTGAALTERESMMACQAELAEGLLKAGDTLEKLLKLNRPIRLAKVMRGTGAAMAAYGALTLNPALVLQGQQLVARAEKILKTLRMTQTGLVEMGRTQLILARFQAREALNKAWRDQNLNQSKALQTVQGQSWFLDPPRLAVRPTNPKDPYPEYELEPDFSKRQTQSLFWKVSYQATREVQSWTKMKWTQPQNCQVTLIERQKNSQTFQVRLSEVKLFSKFWSSRSF